MPEELPSISTTLDAWDASTHQKIYHAATTAGIILLKSGLTATPAPFPSITRLFDALVADPALGKSLNATSPPGRPLYKNANAPRPRGRRSRPRLLDLSQPRLSRIPAPLRAELGGDFDEVVSFYDVLMHAVPALLCATSLAAGGHDLAPLHRTGQFNLRLCDYTPRDYCGAHVDYATLTVVFQSGGLEVRGAAGEWLLLPPEVPAVVLWGRCAAVLSAERIRAVEHRVRRPEGRRNALVFFVEPDSEVVLTPLERRERERARYGRRIEEGRVTVGQFKEEMTVLRRYKTSREVVEVIYGKQEKEGGATPGGG